MKTSIQTPLPLQADPNSADAVSSGPRHGAACLGGFVVATAWAKRLTVLLVLLATLASMSPRPGPRSLRRAQRPAPPHRSSSPGRSTGPPPEGTHHPRRVPATSSPESDQQSRELVERRTEDSRTVVAVVAPLVTGVVAGAKCTAGSERACETRAQNASFIDPQAQDDTGGLIPPGGPIPPKRPPAPPAAGGVR